MGVQKAACVSSSFSQDFRRISDVLQQILKWVTGNGSSQQTLENFSAISSPTRKRNVDKKLSNLEDLLKEHSGSSKESLCWFSVEIPNTPKASADKKDPILDKNCKIDEKLSFGWTPDLILPPPSYQEVISSAPPLESTVCEPLPSAPVKENFGPLLVVDLPPEYSFKYIN